MNCQFEVLHKVLLFETNVSTGTLVLCCLTSQHRNNPLSPKPTDRSHTRAS